MNKLIIISQRMDLTGIAGSFPELNIHSVKLDHCV